MFPFLDHCIQIHHMVDYGLNMACDALSTSRLIDRLRSTGRAVKSNLVFVPNNIEIRDGLLVWDRPSDTGRENWVEPKDAMLIRFTKLHLGTDEAILKFAKRYGVLGAVELVPNSPKFGNEIPFGGQRWLVSTDGDGPVGDPLGLWRGLSRRFDATLRLAAELAKDPPVVGDAKYWQYLIEDPNYLPDVEDAQFLIMFEVKDWLQVGRVGLSLDIKDFSRRRTEWETSIEYRGLYNLLGALATQLMLTVAGSALHSCSGCGSPIISDRRPKRGQRNYCDDCRIDGRPLKDADRDRKQRMADARRLHCEGIPLREIQSRLGIRQLSTARRWIGGK
jgi:hypothetical protein